MSDNTKPVDPPQGWRGPITATACADCGSPLLFGDQDQSDPLKVRCPRCGEREMRITLLSAALRLSMLALRLERGAAGGSDVGASEVRALGEQLSDLVPSGRDRDDGRQVRRRRDD